MAGAKILINTVGVSEHFVGTVLVGLVVVIPETSVMILASKRGSVDLSFSNLIGDCLASVPFVLGVMIILCPLSIDETTIHVLLSIWLFATIVFVLLILFDPLKLRNPSEFDIKTHEAISLLILYFMFSYFLYVC